MQEAIKVISNQFVPFTNTLIFDGLEGRIYTLQA